MKINYVVYDPTKNITALVTSPVEREQQAVAAGALMARHPEVEQVGFIEQPTLPGACVRLQMMGGEFCGNATMSAAAYMAEQDTEKHGVPGTACFGATVPLEVSGAEGLLTCALSRQAHGGFLGTVAMPLPQSVSVSDIPAPWDFPRPLLVGLVEFPGITHCIVSAEQVTREEVETLIRPQFAAVCKALHTDACGVLLYDEPASSFAPLVYVASTNTAVWESGCGSGSAAIGAYTACRQSRARPERSTFEVSLHQPGGVIRVRTEVKNGVVTALSITGRVVRCGSGELTL